MTQALCMILLPFVAALLWIAFRRGRANTPLRVAFYESSEIAIFTWFGLLGLFAVIYFRTH